LVQQIAKCEIHIADLARVNKACTVAARVQIDDTIAQIAASSPRPSRRSPPRRRRTGAAKE